MYMYIMVMNTCIQNGEIGDGDVLYEHMRLMSHMFMHHELSVI
jgi:pentatricopeptide repeat protein